MVKQTDVNRIRGEVFGLFQAPCSIHANSDAQGRVSFEIVVFTPYMHNIGKGSSLAGCLQMLKKRNGKE